MAKGRKLTTSRSELLLGSYGYGGPAIQTDDVVELQEDDVWSMVDGMVNRTRAAVEINTRSRYRSSVQRGGGGGSGRGGGLSSAFEDAAPPGKMVTSSPRIVHQFVSGASSLESPRGRHVATSAPVNVPDWSKIYHRVDSADSLRDDSEDVMINDHDSDMVPPHEYLARAYAQSRDSAENSVFVGAGRTLKGRDLSRVRDAVWSRTGFNG